MEIIKGADSRIVRPTTSLRELKALLHEEMDLAPNTYYLLYPSTTDAPYKIVTRSYDLSRILATNSKPSF
jgi:hypothetical protein